MKTEKAEKLHDIDKAYSLVTWILFIAVGVFISWAMIFELDQFVRAQGQVVSSSRVQIIQSVDGGLLSEIHVAEGDLVEAGQVLARIDQTRFAAQTNEIKVRVYSLMAKVARLRGEVRKTFPDFPDIILDQKEIINLELAVYEQRLKRLMDETSAQKKFIALARKEKSLMDKLYNTGDIAQTEILDMERKIIDAELKLESIRNTFYEKASGDLSESEKELAENMEVFLQRNALLESAILRAPLAGIVKNLSVTTIGAVTRSGEELMQIVPVDDDLLVEAKVPPVDIGDLHVGLPATLRLDPFDPSVYGTIDGDVVFISADTISEKNSRGDDQKFYIARIRLPGTQATTSIGRQINIIPGMTSQVDIKTGKRTVMNYIMKPIIKTVSNSFGEK